jgi:hypothetical protein
LAKCSATSQALDQERIPSRPSRAVRIDAGMTSYAEMARERKKARTLYLELRALNLELYAKDDPYDATGYRVRVAGLHSLSETHAEWIRRRVEESKPGLLRVLFGRWDPDVVAIQREGATR